ncbi:hypothetical protein VNI00_017218 [Paramarasmius palmivorus]|uniref:F-box domain-containing protein n=1 Tax=Paramarasmius palmivorus TaxID=297713 RepID=A0AAW0B707_9AGAR
MVPNHFDSSLSVTKNRMASQNIDINLSKSRPPSRITIGRFPNEVLLHFFGICRDHATEEDIDDFDLDPDELFRKTHPILTVSQTCSHWRTLALSSPQLWASIHVRFHESDDLQRAFTIRDTVSLYLQRSANLPLDIDIHAFTSEFDGPLHHQACLLLFKHGSRWRHLTLQLDRQDPLILPRMPLLESFSISKLEVGILALFVQRSSVGEMKRFEAPRLRRLEVTAPMRIGFSNFFDTKALTHLVLCAPHITDFLNILRSAKNLLELELMGMSGVADISRPSTVASNLRKLVATGLTATSFSALFRHVTLPSLSMLEMLASEHCDAPSKDGQQVFYSFIQRSNPPLKELQFDTDLLPGRIGDVGRILHMLPSITIFGGHIKEELQPALLEMVKSREVLPNLENLVLLLWEGLGTCGSLLIRVLKDRMKGTGSVGALKSFKLRCNTKHLHAEVEAGLKELEKHGLEIEWDIDPEWPYRASDFALSAL